MVATKSWDFCRSLLNAPTQHKSLLIIIVLLLLFYTTTGKTVKNKNFDYFVFSQRWLPTACIEYVEHNPSHSLWCTLPKNYDIWTIHGLWPTQNHHIGPFFCNSSMVFDEAKIQSIESDLKTNWPNIEGGRNVTSLWKHEWDKHGTCAAQLEILDSEIKYFSTGVHLLTTYNINDLFQKYSIKPSFTDGVMVDDLFKIIKATFGKLPQIRCVLEVKSKEPYLAEIRLCYNKKLELIDCGNMFANKFNSIKSLTNCPIESRVKYPSNFHSQVTKSISNALYNKEYYNSLWDILNSLRFLMWISI